MFIHPHVGMELIVELFLIGGGIALAGLGMYFIGRSVSRNRWE